jgi:hypothetical protein
LTFLWGKAQFYQFGLGTLDKATHKVAHAHLLLTFDHISTFIEVVAMHGFKGVLAKVLYPEHGLHVEVGVTELLHVFEVGNRGFHDGLAFLPKEL